MIGIIGSSLVGSICQRICQVHSWEYQAFSPPPAHTKKLLLLNTQSVNFIQSLGIDVPIAYTYKQLKVLQANRLNRIILKQTETEQPLCYGVYANDLQTELSKHCTYQNMEIEHGALLNDRVLLQAENKTIPCEYLLGCDGQQSITRQIAQIDQHTREKHYIACIPASIQGDSLIQIQSKTFTIAALPGDRGMIIICSAHRIEASSIRKKKLQDLFKHHCYITEISTPFEYALTPSLSSACYKNNCLLLGNAAMTIEPVAAQGLNHAIHNLKKLHSLTQTTKKELFSIGEDMQKENTKLFSHMRFLCSSSTSTHIAKKYLISSSMISPLIKNFLYSFGNRYD